ncbi:serine O-acetyltransferase [Gracilaria domingensis]|nr:serine O-acetyltransferase [Gracilaria domingensis]
MQEEARRAAADEPLLASFLFATVLNHASLHQALAFHLANKLKSPAMPSTILMRLFQDGMSSCDQFCESVRNDLLAVMERDPACTRFIDALLYFKGFHALQAHRVAHILWKQGRIPLAYHLQSQVSKELQVDIHPAARIGSGVFVDHATGIVIGETAAIGNNCSLLHHVTLGGTGKKHGERHPKLGDGVLVGAGATLLGNLSVGDGAQIGACSLVLADVPAHATVVGVPAKVVSRQGVAVPALDMKHERCLPGCTDESHGHSTNYAASSVSRQLGEAVTTKSMLPH